MHLCLKKAKYFSSEIFLIIIITVFFSKLFFPSLSSFITPDFGRSDILHSNLPARYVLSQSLKSFSLPIWEPTIGQGYPILAEGVIGTFYIPNLILFFIFPFQLAIPLAYVVYFSISAIGFYYLSRYLKLNPTSAILGAISYTFCATFILHVQHPNLIATASLVPILFYSLLVLTDNFNWSSFILAIISASQMIMAGFVQLYVYTIITFFLFFICYQIYVKNLKAKFLLQLTFILIAGIIISSSQILPTFELIKASQRSNGLNSQSILTSYPYGIKNLASFINPFILGSPKDGTYNSTDWKNYGIYWENTAYISIISLIFVFLTLFRINKIKQNKLPVLLAIFAVFTTLLALGKSSPLHIFFSIPPFNFFRVPSRFLLLTQFFMALLAAFGANYITENLKGKIKITTQFLILFFLVLDIFLHWFNYNPVEKISNILKPQATSQLFSDGEFYRVYSLGFAKPWNDLFTKTGWKNNPNSYLTLLNNLNANANLFYGINQTEMFETLPTKRYLLQQEIIKNFDRSSGGAISLSKSAINLLSISSTKYIISPLNINNDGIELVNSVKQNDQVFNVYKNTFVRPLVNIYFDFTKIKDIQDYPEQITNLNPSSQIILEENLPKKLTPGTYDIKNLKTKKGSVEFDLTTSQNVIAAVSQSYYPGWKVYVSGLRKNILPANINSQAVFVDAGYNHIKFVYDPIFLRIGLIISAISYLILTIGYFKLRQTKT